MRLPKLTSEGLIAPLGYTAVGVSIQGGVTPVDIYFNTPIGLSTQSTATSYTSRTHSL